MPTLKTYDIFISHAWSYGDSYKRIIEFLKDAPNFSYRNYSAPSDNPLQNLNGTTVKTEAQVKAAIDRKISPVNCVLVLSGMYVTHHKWMQYEIDTAVRLKRPIIGIRPWGNMRIPEAVSSVADIMVGWNTHSIVQAIRDYSI